VGEKGTDVLPVGPPLILQGREGLFKREMFLVLVVFSFSASPRLETLTSFTRRLSLAILYRPFRESTFL
jgi:hypothetical protein